MEQEIRPLAGVRVLDLTVFLAGPTAGVVLGDWGAEVIKLEDLSGDPMRLAMQSGAFEPAPYNYWWEWANRNKRGVAVNLKHPQGREIAHRLIKKADIFVSNLRPGGLAKLGMDYKTLSQINPLLVYATSTAWGKRGPDAERAGYDDLAWIRSGLMAVHSYPEQPPVVERAAMGDTPTGFFLAAGAVLGLRQREHTGRGLEVNAALLATMMWMNVWAIQQYIASGTKLKQLIRHSASNPLFNTYPTRDGWLQLVLLRRGEWKELCRALGREDLMEDPRFATNEKRCQNNTLLIPILDEIFRSRTTEDWRRRLSQYDLAWESLQDADGVVPDPQVVANDFLIEVDNPKIGSIKQVANPIQFQETPFTPYRPAPELGQHTEEVLLEIGYAPKEIEELETAGVIRCGQRTAQRK